MTPITSRAPARIISTIGLATGLALTLGACSSGTDTDTGTDVRDAAAGPTADTTAGATTPHGYVAGASESQEPQLGLLAVSPSGATAVLDLLSGATTVLDDVDAPAHSATDGRFLVTSTDARTTITDGGRWTVDHGDHTHYYTAEPRVVGTVDGGGPVAVHSSETMTTITWPEQGEAVVLDRAALGQGEVEESARMDATVLLPFGDRLVAGTADGVRVLDADGSSPGAATACVDPTGGIVTRAGAVVGCADGAVVVDDAGGATAVPLPDGAARPGTFAARAGRPTVAALPGSGSGFLLLDAREQHWRQVDTERPLRTVVAVDDADEHVVGVDDLGRVVVSASNGSVATTEQLVDPESASLQLDAQRAYVADAASGQVHEVDFADGARVARTVDLPFAPAAFAEVGL